MKNFWLNLKKPILILAPMENVTDTVFRQIVARCGKPDVFFTEFTSTDGICSEGFAKVAKRLQFTSFEYPIVAQIWGNNPKKYYESAKLLETMGFDGIDINMGCPDRVIVRKGCCSGLIQNKPLAKEIIQATKEGASNLPISVKTRIGYAHVQTEEWIGFLLEQNLDAITIHARIATEMSKNPANWEEIGKAVQMRDASKSNTLIIGNGDIKSLLDALEKYNTYQTDGIMIGRGVFENLWIFNKTIDQYSISTEDKLKLLIEHITLFEKTWANTKHFDILKKFYKVYVSGMPNASELRMKLMELYDAQETINFIKTINHK